MIGKRKWLGVAAAAIATTASVPLGAGPALAATPCRAIPVVQMAGPSQTVLVAGAYTAAGAVDVTLTCGVVRNGRTLVTRTDELVGPVAIVHDTVEIGAGDGVTSCYTLRVLYADGHSTVSGSCP